MVRNLKRVLVRAKVNLIRLLPTESIFYLREAMIWTLPCAIMSAIFVATAFMFQLIGIAPEFVANLSSLNKIFSGLIPIVATSSLAYILSVKNAYRQCQFLCWHSFQRWLPSKSLEDTEVALIPLC
jgi:cellobiose-specific phosphotransferase system component IIC